MFLILVVYFIKLNQHFLVSFIMSNDLISFFLQTQLIGVIIGGALTLFSSYYIFFITRRDELRAIGRGFSIELEIQQDWIQHWIEKINRYNDANFTELFLSNDQDYHRPFISEESLYYVFRKEIFKFDKELAGNLFRFYSLLKGAEESRRYIIANRGDRYSPGEHLGFQPQEQKNSILHIKRNFDQGINLIPNIMSLLKSLQGNK